VRVFLISSPFFDAFRRVCELVGAAAGVYEGGVEVDVGTREGG